MNKQKGFSTLLGILLAVAVLGGGAYFYTQKEMPVEHVENNVVSTSTPVAEKKEDAPRTKSSAVVHDIWEYTQLAYFKKGTDLYLLSYSSFENEYSGSTYHVDLKTNSVTPINSPVVLEEGGRMLAAKQFRVDSEDRYDNGKFDGYDHDQAQLEQISKETGIAKGDLKLIPTGGKPVFYVLVKGVYDPTSKKLVLAKEQTNFPVLNNVTRKFEWEGKAFQDTFTEIGVPHDLAENSVTKDGVEFNYNAGTKILSITY